MIPTSRPIIRHVPCALACAAALALGACKSNSQSAAASATEQPSDQQAQVGTDQPASPSLRIGAGRYAGAFEACKHTLRDLGFLIERVDAQGGVITTQPKGTGGLATPWDTEQSGLDQELEDSVHRQQRVVRVEFTPVAASGAIDDLRAFSGDIEARIQVAVLRTYQPGRRINTGNIVSSTYTTDPALQAKGLTYYTVAQKQDYRLAQRIADRVAANLAQSATVTDNR